MYRMSEAITPHHSLTLLHSQKKKKSAKIVSLGVQQLVTGAVPLERQLYTLSTP